MRYEVNAVMQYSRSNKLAGCRLKDTIVLSLPTDRFKLEQATHDKSQDVTQPYCCYPEGYAAPGNVQGQCNARGPLSKLEETPPQRKIDVTSKSPVGDISVVTLIRTDTTLDHSQKAEKVWQSG